MGPITSVGLLKSLALAVGAFSMWRKSQGPRPHRGDKVQRIPANHGAIGGTGSETQSPPSDTVNEQPQSEHHGPLRILVAEDNAINRKVMELTLRRMGYEADMAVDGLEAVEMATANEYDAILMDLHMPGMGGIEATKVIVGTLPKPPRVVAVTADVTSQSREDCKRVGMAAYLTKPVDSGKLLYELKAAEVHRLSYAKTG